MLHFTLDPYLIMLSVKQGGIKYHFFEPLVWLDQGSNPGIMAHWQILYSGPWYTMILLFLIECYAIKKYFINFYLRWKNTSLQRMILFVEIFANIKRFSFKIFIRAFKLLNEIKKMRKFRKILFQLIYYGIFIIIRYEINYVNINIDRWGSDFFFFINIWNWTLPIKIEWNETVKPKKNISFGLKMKST